MKEGILIDEKNKQILLSIQNSINELRARMNLICMAILNVKEIEGNFDLSPDCSKLVLRE